MSKTSLERNSLPPLQKRIVLALAESGPVTKNQLMKNLRSPRYKAVWTALNSLIEKKSVRAAGIMPYRGRVFPTYWLTGIGIMEALCHGANTDTLKTHGFNIYPDEKVELELMVEMAKNIGSERLRTIFEMFRPAEDGKLVLRAIPIPFDEEELKAIASAVIAGASPEMLKRLKKAMDILQAELSKLSSQ